MVIIRIGQTIQRAKKESEINIEHFNVKLELKLILSKSQMNCRHSNSLYLNDLDFDFQILIFFKWDLHFRKVKSRAGSVIMMNLSKLTTSWDLLSHKLEIG